MRDYKFLILVLMLCSSCSLKTNTKQVEEFGEVELEHSCNEISEYELVWDSMFDVESNQYYVYIYSTSCSHCLEIKNYMIETALTRGDIYFTKGTSKDQITNDPEMIKNAENPGDIWILGYPTLLKIENKKCVKNLAGKTLIFEELK